MVVTCWERQGRAFSVFLQNLTRSFGVRKLELVVENLLYESDIFKAADSPF